MYLVLRRWWCCDDFLGCSLQSLDRFGRQGIIKQRRLLFCSDMTFAVIQFSSVQWVTGSSGGQRWLLFCSDITFAVVQFSSVHGSPGRQRWVLFCSDKTFAVVQFSSVQFISRLVRRETEMSSVLLWCDLRLFSHLTDLVVGGTLKTMQQRWLLFCSAMTFAVI